MEGHGNLNKEVDVVVCFVSIRWLEVCVHVVVAIEGSFGRFSFFFDVCFQEYKVVMTMIAVSCPLMSVVIIVISSYRAPREERSTGVVARPHHATL